MSDQQVSPQQLLQAMQMQVAAQIGASLQKKITDRCFLSCLDKVHSSLKSREHKCVARCAERWWEASLIIKNTLLGDMKDTANMDESMIGFDSSLTSESSMTDDWHR